MIRKGLDRLLVTGRRRHLVSPAASARGLHTGLDDERREVERIREELRSLGSGKVTLQLDLQLEGEKTAEYNGRKSAIALITVSNPERKNALSGKMMAELSDCVDSLSSWPGCCVILTGEGSSFCSGADLGVARERLNTKEAGRDMCLLMTNTLTRLRQVSPGLRGERSLGNYLFSLCLSTRHSLSVFLMVTTCKLGFASVTSLYTTLPPPSCTVAHRSVGSALNPIALHIVLVVDIASPLGLTPAQLPIISIAAIEGPAIGGGAELSTACDHRILSRSAKVQFVHVRMGVSPGWGGGGRLSLLVGRQRALRMIGTAEPLAGQLALETGFADGLADEGEALEESLKLAKSYAAGAPGHHFASLSGSL